MYERSYKMAQESARKTIHKKVASDTLLAILPDIVKDFHNELEEKEIKVNLPVVKQTVTLDVDLNYFKIILHEIFTNGIKYSKTKSNVFRY